MPEESDLELLRKARASWQDEFGLRGPVVERKVTKVPAFPAFSMREISRSHIGDFPLSNQLKDGNRPNPDGTYGGGTVITPLEWWTFNGTLVGAVHGITFQPPVFFGPSSSADFVGGIVNQAFSLTGDGTHGDQVITATPPGSNAYLAATKTIIGWFKSNDGDASKIGMNIAFRTFGTAGTAFSAATILLRNNVPPSFQLNTGIPLTASWHFFVADISSSTVKVQFNNTGTVYTFGSNFGGAAVFLQGIDFSVDEIAVFDKVLTSTQKDFLYNGGAGQTWPCEIPE